MADQRTAGTGQLGIYRRLVGARLRSDLQYRTSFLVFLVAQILVSALDLAVIAVIFGQVDALAGWSGAEVALLYGIGGVAFGLADLFVSQVETASRHIKAGTFDRFLLRPIGPLLQLSATEFALRRVGRVLQPLVVLVLAVPAARVAWSPVTAWLLVTGIASGTVIFGAVWVITSSVAFWTVETQEFSNAFTYGGNHLVQYPLGVLSGWLRRVVTFAVPLAFVAYLPAAEILAKPDRLGLPGALAYATPMVAAISALVARAAWRAGIRQYCSTGS